MPEIEICECGHWREDHIVGECHNCGYYYKYGELKEKRGGSTCPQFKEKYTATLAVIDEVELSKEDHGILTLSIGTKNDSSHQSYGGYSLDDYSKKKNRRIGHMIGTEIILQVLDYFDIRKLEDLKGQYVFVLRDDSRGTIQGLKRLDVNEKIHDNKKWFSFQEVFKEWGMGDD